MINLEKYKKIKDYGTYTLYEHKEAGYRECFINTDINDKRNEVQVTKPALYERPSRFFDRRVLC